MLTEPQNNPSDPPTHTHKLIGTNCWCQFNFLSKARAVIHLIFICLVSGRLGEKNRQRIEQKLAALVMEG